VAERGRREGRGEPGGSHTRPRGVGPAWAQSELCSHFKVDAASKEAKAMHKSFFFHPISTAEVHRPVGDINEYRCEYYARHAHARLAHMQEGTGVVGHAIFPFDEIKSNVSAFKREQP